MRAKRAICNVCRERLESLPILWPCESVNEALSDLREASGTDATRNGLSTCFVSAPARQHGGELWNYHTSIECKERARTNVCANRGESCAAVRRTCQ
jgi:hypothetical protein